MLHSRVHIEAGDLVIIFMSRDNMSAIKVTPGQSFHNKYGRYLHEDMIGMKFGSKMHSPPPQSGYIHLLRPTPELWTLSLPHRTQILYMPDIAYITMRLGVRVGGKVIEAGTGSGSMTHSLSRTVGSTGNVHSFEYHQARYEKALEEFEEHGLRNIHLQHRNVCKDGFGEVTDVEAIFLDLPAPWEAIPHAVKVLRPDIITRICCFSPCLEQVLKTVTSLRAEGFSDISTQEVLVRTYDLVAPPPSGSAHLSDVSSIVQRLSDHEKRKEERRVTQMRNAREKIRLIKEAQLKDGPATETIPANETDITTDQKRKRDGIENDQSIEFVTKRARTDTVAVVTTDDSKTISTEPSPIDDATALPENNDERKSEDEECTPGPSRHHAEPLIEWSSMVLTKPSPEMRGHTSYLTFATFYPASVRSKIAAQDDIVPTPSRRSTPASGHARSGRVGELAAEMGANLRAGSEETEYGSEGMDEVMGTLTEEEMIALAGV